MKKYFVYILDNWGGTLNTGITNYITKKILEHKNKTADWQVSKINLNKIVYVEEMRNIDSAVKREKQIKSWSKQWQKELIDSVNPKWLDLTEKKLPSKDSAEKNI
ncbi:MAG: hypothetical protein ACD_3C00207G0007 [uncultured bacterium (gcode 4)]|uniref:GIY-YIG domain-containing protein n=1 Tax=uncultured bacterium (gcode 4) TaxID=1234023 RepID=K2FZV2_9BACT|nr:MAG: hypothetical protein ACD_3C00207G0007 [uncultured bacterium (gcode 4)]